MKFLPGLAIIEVLIVLGIFVLLATFTTILSTTAIRNAEFDRIRETVRSELITAQINTIGGTNDSAWGVAFSTSSIVRYNGSSYATRNTLYDHITTFSNVAIVLSGATNTSFVRPYGLPTTNTTIVIKNENATATATVSTAGIISIQ